MGARGEGTIQAEGREVQVLFTNRAIAKAETALGRSILDVANGFADGQSGIRDVAMLLLAGMEAARRDARAGGRAFVIDDAYDVLDEAGFSVVAEVVMLAISDVLAYGVDADGNRPAGGEADPN